MGFSQRATAKHTGESLEASVAPKGRLLKRVLVGDSIRVRAEKLFRYARRVETRRDSDAGRR